MNTALSVIVLITSLVIIVSVAMQESEQAGLGTLDGTSSEWGKNKGNSKKEYLNRVIIVSSIVFSVALLVLAVV